MQNIIKSIFKHKKFCRKNKSFSFSQCGEDRIVLFLANTIHLQNLSYIDVGAHDPVYLSNTALLHQLGSTGVNIEPDPILFQKFVKERKTDINLNIGISNAPGELPFYIMDAKTLNTFSVAEAHRYESLGHKIEKEVIIKVESIDNIITTFCGGFFPDFLNLDAEGVDDLVISGINRANSMPKIICVETIEYNTTGICKKNANIINQLESLGYFLYADTYLNSIFVDKSLFENR